MYVGCTALMRTNEVDKVLLHTLWYHMTISVM